MNDLVLSRRAFLGLASLLLTGCATALPGDFKIVAKGFNVYTKMNPNIRITHGTFKIWRQYLNEWGYAHTGDSYDLPSNTPIVASAAGTVVEAGLLYGTGYSKTAESGDRVKIQHDDDNNSPSTMRLTGLHTVYYHMRSNSTVVKAGQQVERGQVIGYEGGPRGMHVKHLLGHDMFFREQSNNWGDNMGYMKYWDGKKDLDLPPDEVSRRRVIQENLIENLIDNYNGPSAFMLKSQYLHLKHQGAMSRENVAWSKVERFKLSEFLYEQQPQLFSGTTKSNDNLIAEIFVNQPVVLTIPLKRP